MGDCVCVLFWSRTRNQLTLIKFIYQSRVPSDQPHRTELHKGVQGGQQQWQQDQIVHEWFTVVSEVFGHRLE